MLHRGDLIFVRSRVGRPVEDLIAVGEYLIEREQKQKIAHLYCHVAVYVGGNTVYEAQGGRKSGPANLGDYSGEYDIGHLKITDNQRRAFLRALSKENGLPYDWAGIWWLIVYILTFKQFGRRYHERRRRYCSKYVEWALALAGVVVDGLTPSMLALDEHVQIEVCAKGRR
ncbi:hypothetical protein NZD89_09385 [Alicyclobacillus fastidiosus]|uniref:LRAT domain-containing protein n=1 Tax=Alicyclobacillus fastidiosus TaxID=392011 RepID=A0ABY6ZL48_9BACL|nr:hypothetical protein [Alicyclobacillus fastidiosus]WAH43569.1 hypothetical protein NZD89_09385 [Alicyclobacillus fastidiosus]GMA59747.1 hypothetical protein GCM10025859_01870 [Alicyclobacillus fastidiosus]